MRSRSAALWCAQSHAELTRTDLTVSRSRCRNAHFLLTFETPNRTRKGRDRENAPCMRHAQMPNTSMNSGDAGGRTLGRISTGACFSLRVALVAVPSATIQARAGPSLKLSLIHI